MTACISPWPVAPVSERLPVARADLAGREVRTDLRCELWLAVIRGLNESGIPYCILGAADGAPELAGSDLDFAVPPAEHAAIPQLLAAAAARAGGQLVQAIRHETTATYFVITRQQGDTIGFLNPDCTTDYRRQGRLWMRAEELLRDRVLGFGGFFRPTPDVDFNYYLIKQVLKQTLTDRQWMKLAALYRRSPDPELALSHWPQPSNMQIESALLRNDCAAFRELLPRLACELKSAPYRENHFARASAFVSDSTRLLSRASHPTGLFVRITKGWVEDRTKLADRLAKTMAPAFRRTWVVSGSSPANILRALAESTLVISPNEELAVHALFGGVDLNWQSALSPTENLERAITAVLAHLSERTTRRLKLPSPRRSHPKPRPQLVTLGKRAF